MFKQVLRFMVMSIFYNFAVNMLLGGGNMQPYFHIGQGKQYMGLLVNSELF